jgi:Flp pilus assembly pilin Flp
VSHGREIGEPRERIRLESGHDKGESEAGAAHRRFDRSNGKRSNVMKKRPHVSRRFRRFLQANEAVSALEYAIMVGVVAVALMAALTTFSGTITEALNKISENLKTKTDQLGS